MNSIDEVVRVAVVANGPRQLSDPPSRPAGHGPLLRALASHAIPGVRVDVLDARGGAAVEPHHDLIHVLDADDGDALGFAAIGREHDIGLIAASPTVAQSLDPGAWRLILSPTRAADRRLLAAGADPAALWRWQPGIDAEAFGPAHYRAGSFGPPSGLVNVLHVGALDDPTLVLEAFTVAVAREPRLRLHLLGAGAAARVGLTHLAGVARALPMPDPRSLAGLYASADLLLHSGERDGTGEFPIPIREAQASGLAVLAVDTSASAELIEDGRDGCLVPATVPALAEALRSLARRAALRERLAVGGLNRVRGRSWGWALNGLADAWNAALTPAGVPIARAA